MNYYIADMHFGHENVLRFDNRTFHSTDEMEEALIQNWNTRVTEDDTVYVLGDAFWKNEENSIRIIQKLNGHKHLIQGNHDRVHGRLSSFWESIAPYAEINDGDKLVILCHYPIPFYKKQHYGAVMLYGHVHNTREWQFVEKWKKEQWEAGIPNRLINVGCMMPYMQYTPRTLEEILASNPMPEIKKAEQTAASDGDKDCELLSANQKIVSEIEETVTQIKNLYDLAYTQYARAVEAVLAIDITDEKLIEQLLDGVIEFGGDVRFLGLMRQLCKHISTQYPQLVGAYACMFRALYEECEEKEPNMTTEIEEEKQT